MPTPSTSRRSARSSQGTSLQLGDYLIVNYDRKALGREGAGHISPLAAYDAETDRVLVMDTAAYRYPPTWVPLGRLYAAMATRDSGSDRARGYVEARGIPAE